MLTILSQIGGFFPHNKKQVNTCLQLFLRIFDLPLGILCSVFLYEYLPTLLMASPPISAPPLHFPFSSLLYIISLDPKISGSASPWIL